MGVTGCRTGALSWCLSHPCMACPPYGLGLDPSPIIEAGSTSMGLGVKSAPPEAEAEAGEGVSLW